MPQSVFPLGDNDPAEASKVIDVEECHSTPWNLFLINYYLYYLFLTT